METKMTNQELESKLTGILTTTNRDECSGTTTLSDGTKVYWTEGYSDVIFIGSDGTRWIECPTNYSNWSEHMHTVTELGNTVEPGATRAATDTEEVDWIAARANVNTEEALEIRREWNSD